MLERILEVIMPLRLETEVVVVDDHGKELRTYYTTQSRHCTRWSLMRSLRREQKRIGEPTLVGNTYHAKVGINYRAAAEIDDVVDDFQWALQESGKGSGSR